ncbi:MAG: FAD/NAD(P)-binding oxidoreductase [Patescibacteria group bacterium]
MKKTDYLIVGGSAAGTTAADTIRNLNSDATIAIVTEEDYPQYSLVLIPHYIRGKISREQVFLKKPQWYNERKIELIKGVRAEGLGSSEKTVKLSNSETIQFGKLLLTVGGKVIPFNVPGADVKNLLYMRTIDDADKIIDIAKKSKKALIIGGGFIGLEFASCFAKNGVVDITALVLEDFYWQGKLDSQSSQVVAGVLTNNGIKIETKVSVDHFETKEGMITAAIAKDGRRFEADAVGVGVGIRSDLSFLEGSGLKIDRGIVTNEYLETNLPDVYAAGDCAQFWDSVFKREHILGNWANATSQGLAVGKTMTGLRTKFETASSYTTNFFDGSCSFLGVTDEKFAENIIIRGSADEGKISRIFVKKYPSLSSGQVARIIGATVVNNVGEVAPLTMAIKNKVDVTNHVSDLDKVDFDLKSLIAL